ncbi:DUF489 family protein, partial [Salmonella enterica]|uniref:DUF489 family protein n=1 Tax=Salmonella enterica TaxID=28901 RepID=UPI00398C31CB
MYGGSEDNLRLGLEERRVVLDGSGRQELTPERTRYTLSRMVLERKLASAKGALDTLGDLTNGLQRQLVPFDSRSVSVMIALVALCQHWITPFAPHRRFTLSAPSMLSRLVLLSIPPSPTP